MGFGENHVTQLPNRRDEAAAGTAAAFTSAAMPDSSTLLLPEKAPLRMWGRARSEASLGDEELPSVLSALPGEAADSAAPNTAAPDTAAPDTAADSVLLGFEYATGTSR